VIHEDGAAGTAKHGHEDPKNESEAKPGFAHVFLLESFRLLRQFNHQSGLIYILSEKKQGIPKIKPAESAFHVLSADFLHPVVTLKVRRTNAVRARGSLNPF
jgi:hypothetical protein